VTDVWIVIKVIDFGIGIPEKEITKILEPFYRADNTKSIAGHGIGLSLSNKIFKIHKGNIQLFSNLGFGTRVFMALPVAK
jgi:signal transduction histidine kinase